MGLRWLVIAAVGLRATTAAADPAPEPPPAWPHTRYATGEWAGRRPSLEAHGVELLADYTAEVFARVTGARALRYRGNLNLWLTLSTEQLGWWPGGQIFVAGELAHGSGVSDGLGALTPVSNLEAASFTELSELWLDQAFGAHAGLRLGKQDVNAELGGPR
ncbi:MAG TPA: hypothetical protein VHE35_36630, partial [Kofleriaceae bacterium]|nr:hypothetical protein [Kofleriaceae bacterium]